MFAVLFGALCNADQQEQMLYEVGAGLPAGARCQLKGRQSEASVMFFTVASFEALGVS